MCDCCQKSNHPHNKVVPESEQYVQTAQYGRVNGWSCPLHPIQVLGWFFITLFAVTHFAIIVHYLPLEWSSAGVIIPASGYVIHFVYHLLALTLDPADPAVRRKGLFQKQIFDKKKQTHVIENSFCYICQTEVSSRSKHCSKCNKCVADFDHHCMWLNNCVGGRNYKLFLGSCLSAFLTALVMFMIDFYLMIMYYTARSDVLGRSSMNDWKLFVSTCKEAYIIFVIVNGLLLLISMFLLGHLILFHGYLCCKKMSTYEYIMQSRGGQSAKGSLHSDIESAGEPGPPPMRPLTSQYTEESKEKRSSFEMQQMTENPLYVGDTVKIIHDTTDDNDTSPVIEKQLYSTSITNVYEVPGGESPDGKPSTTSKKKKHRTSSKVELIRNDCDDDSLSSAHSVHSVDTELERYNQNRNESVLERFRSPENGHLSKSHPTRLSEETAYANIQIDRNESAIDRPISPSPKPSQRISFVNQQNDYVMRVMDKRASNSSLSTLALQDHDEQGIPISPSHVNRISKPALSPTREESFDSKQSSKNSVLSTRRVEVQNRSDIPEETVLLDEQRITSPSLSLSNGRPVFGTQEQENVRASQSETSQLSLSEAFHSKRPTPQNIESPRLSVTSELTNITLTSEKFPIVPSETELTSAVPLEDKPATDDLVLTNALSEDGTLVFEDEFADVNEENIDFLHQSMISATASIEAEERRRSPSRSPNANLEGPPSETALAFDPGFVSDADSHKMASYVEAFKRKRPESQFSFGSDSGGSESGVPIAVLNEEADTFALTDSLQRVKKLSDAFPTANELDKSKKSSLPQPRFYSQESMSELSVVEYNRKKKLKKKRPIISTSGSKSKKELPPLRGRKPLAEVTEENDRSDTDV